MFVKRPRLGLRLLLLGLLSVGLMVADAHYHALDLLRERLDWALAPMIELADWPLRLYAGSRDSLSSRQQLARENDALRTERLLLSQKAQKMAALQAENIRLRQLLNSTTHLDENALIAEIIGVSSDPSRHFVIIDRGAKSGIREGQPLLDASGIMGQVISVRPHHSRVLLITDQNHAVPVQVLRNGVRAIAVGTGDDSHLELLNVPETSDIEVGDQLVTSGLGGRFPANYPVGVVESVNRNAGQPFTQIRAIPTAQLAISRHVLVILTTPQPGQNSVTEATDDAQ
ncbi:MAG TPA: rod shape-determining protein MreC [Pseudomonadales bacterium]|nr:rod shape-determining protein MreC [Pseudomonadales bacterium]HMY95790.1 rod shape-determining protein MreC [Pseudomonadales bacterium]HMZ90850.1 rod shape-determining protein MreC [Pseudomonadales bacterium]HNF07710.1 rod shape-determining protein MreC [Pseudomonadales bacterium]HQN40603.1 rod shape-determining protein MreC [Pseudomonadales bacterium]